LEDLLEAVGYGLHSAQAVANFIHETQKEAKEDVLPSEEKLIAEVLIEKEQPRSGIIIDSLAGVAFRLARCCNPTPAHEIAGYITRGRGVTIHRKDCLHLKNEEAARVITASWGKDITTNFAAALQIHAIDRPNLLQQMLLQIQNAKISLHSVNARKLKNSTAMIDLVLEVSSLEQLQSIKDRLLRMKDVLAVEHKQ
jgi:GTP pyrophosphokinase